jgi:hypothetical protein
MKLRPQTEEKSKGGMKERRQICLKNVSKIRKEIFYSKRKT